MRDSLYRPIVIGLLLLILCITSYKEYVDRNRNGDDRTEQTSNTSNNSVADEDLPSIKGKENSRKQEENGDANTNWALQDKIAFGQLIVSFFAFVAAVVAGYIAYGAFKATTDQLTLSNPPKLIIAAIHIWNKGEGAVFLTTNPPPNIIANNVISGVAFALNVGGNEAVITGSDIVVKFIKGGIGMNYPGWGNPGHNPLKIFAVKENETIYSNTPVSKIAPGEQGYWEFEASVPDGDAPGDLVVIGNVVYRDALNVQHGAYFAQRYDPSVRNFTEEHATAY